MAEAKRKSFWRNPAERKSAVEVHKRHPEWGKEKIRDFLRHEGEFTPQMSQSQNAVVGSFTDEDKAVFNLPLAEVIDSNRDPKGFKSPLNDVDWINHYLYYTLLVDEFGNSTPLYKTQERISKWFDEYLWAAADVFRGVGKTVVSLGKTIRRMADNPNVKLALITEEATRSIQRVGVVKQTFQTNKLIINDYGYLPHDKAYQGYKGKWSGSMLQLKRNMVAQEPTLIGISQGSTQMLGYHFNGVLIDDPWSTELQAEKNSLEKWMRWFTETFMGCIEKGAFCWMLFTRKGVEDLYSSLIYEKGLFKAFKQPAVLQFPTKWRYEYDKEKKIVYDQILGVPKVSIESNDGIISDDCYGRFSMPFLLGKRYQMGATKFEQEFQCSPVPSDQKALLDWNKLKFYNDPRSKITAEEKLDPDRASYVAFMDQAFGMSEKADYTVIAVIGVEGIRAYIDRIYRGRWSSGEKIEVVKQCFQDYPKITKMGIESGWMQTNVAKEIMSNLQGFPLIEVSYGGAQRKYGEGVGSVKEFEAKVVRIIDQFTPFILGDRLYVNAAMDQFHEFEKEFRGLGFSKHDDIVDACGGALEMINQSLMFRFFMAGTGATNRSAQF